MNGRVAFVTDAKRGVGAAVARRPASVEAGVAGDFVSLSSVAGLPAFPGESIYNASNTPDMPELEGMMSAEEVAEVAQFAVTRPRGLCMMTLSFRPLSEPSWG